MDTLTSRIAKLLAHAENTYSAEEAQTFFAKAQQLAAQHSIDMAVARHQLAAAGEPEQPEQRTIDLGAQRTLGLKEKVLLFQSVAKNNDLRMFIAHDSTCVYPIGFPSDLDVAEQLYNVLAEQMVRFGAEWVQSGQWKGETYGTGEWAWQDSGYGEVTKPVTARVARTSFYRGFVAEVDQRLRDARRDAVEAAEAANTATGIDTTGKELSVTTLALRDKEQTVNEFTEQQRKEMGVRGSWRGSRARGAHSTTSGRAGGNAGKKATMSTSRAIA